MIKTMLLEVKPGSLFPDAVRWGVLPGMILLHQAHSTWMSVSSANLSIFVRQDHCDPAIREPLLVGAPSVALHLIVLPP
jgi:hypothetical protein